MYTVENTPPEVGHKDAKAIQLEDTDKADENERLDVILYDDNIVNVHAGELVKIIGEVKIHLRNAGVNPRCTKIHYMQNLSNT